MWEGGRIRAVSGGAFNYNDCVCETASIRSTNQWEDCAGKRVAHIRLAGPIPIQIARAWNLVCALDCLRETQGCSCA